MSHSRHTVGRSAVLSIVLFALAASVSAAQDGMSVTVARPTQSGDEGVTVKVKDGNQNFTLSNFTGQQGSKHTGDDLPKDMDPAEKAKRIAKAINEAPENTRADGTPRVKASADGSKVTVEPADKNVKVKKFEVNSNTKEKKDKLAMIDTDADSVFTATLAGTLAYEDGSCKPSVLHVATARGTVEIALSAAASPHEALLQAADGLAQFGVAAWVDGNTIGFVVDGKSDQFAEFGSTDLGTVPTASLASIEAEGGEGE